ncbi:hypothetical protein M1D52_08495 [Olivibacter sp. SA151]
MQLNETLLGLPIIDFFWATLVMVSLLFLVFIVILFFLIEKNRAADLRKSWQQLIAIVIYEAASADIPLQPPTALNDHLTNRRFRKYLARSLVNAEKSLSGIAASNLKVVYKQLRLDKDSIARLSSRHAHIVASAIQELSAMQISEAEPEIVSLVNHYKDIIRLEAQYGLVRLKGFQGLAFLDDLQNPISDWQQLKLLSAIGQLPLNAAHHVQCWLNSDNQSVVIFALKLIAKFQLLELHENVLLKISASSKKVQMQSLKTLERISQENTAAAVIEVYDNASDAYKMRAIRVLENIAGINELNFLLHELYNNDNSQVRLGAARAILNCSAKGVAVLEETKKQLDEPAKTIINQAMEGHY